MAISRYIVRSFSVSVILLLILNGTAFSQGTDIRAGGKPKHLFLGFHLGGGVSELKLTGSSDFTSALPESKSGFSAGIDIGYSFNRFVGLSTGLGLTVASSSINMNSYSAAYDTTDYEGEKYNRRITGTNIHEDDKFSFLRIPLALNLHIPFTKGFGLYLQGGINFCKPLEKSYDATGAFSYTGYYPAYNVTISDIGYEGFQSDYKANVSGDRTMKSMYNELFASGGFQINIGTGTTILIGAYYTTMDAGSNNTKSSSFRLSSYPGKMKSIMGGATKATINSAGLKLSMRFYL